MKLTSLIVLTMVVSATGVVQAHDVPTVTRTGPNGKTLVLQLDGKYSTCLRDGQRLGYSYDSAKRYCDARPNLKK